MLRLVKDQMRRKSEDEFRMELTGRFMALFATANSKKEWKREDFFHLSYDKPVEERPLTFKEAKALLGSRIKRDGKQ
jgi:hypothetical protein